MVLQKTRNRRWPHVNEAHEFLEITRDFTDPKEAIREAISNALDWGATEIRIVAWEDRTVPGDELVLELQDNGAGLDDERLQAFFNLGHPTGVQYDSSSGAKIGGRIGE